MEQYGLFQDEGVKGKDPSKVSPNAKIKGQQAPNSPYRFGTGSSSGTFAQFAKRMGECGLAASVNLFLQKGIENINAYVLSLSKHLKEGLKEFSGLSILSKICGEHRDSSM